MFHSNPFIQLQNIDNMDIEIDWHTISKFNKLQQLQLLSDCSAVIQSPNPKPQTPLLPLITLRILPATQPHFVLDCELQHLKTIQMIDLFHDLRGGKEVN